MRSTARTRKAGAAWLLGLGLCAALLVGLVAFEGCGNGYTVESAPDAASSDAAPDATTEVDSSALGDAGSVDLDAGAEAAAPPCDLAKPFGSPVPYTELSATLQVGVARLSVDERALYAGFSDGGPSEFLASAVRATASGAFGAPTLLPNVNVATAQAHPAISPDGLSLYFDVAAAVRRIYVATRPSASAPFGAPQPVAALGALGNNYALWVTGDGQELFFVSDRSRGAGLDDVWHATLGSGGGIATPVLVAEVASSATDNFPVTNADGTTLYFASTRAGGAGASDIWVARRASRSATFSAPTNVSELNTSGSDTPSWLSADGCRLLVIRSSGMGAAQPLYLARKP